MTLFPRSFARTGASLLGFMALLMVASPGHQLSTPQSRAEDVPLQVATVPLESVSTSPTIHAKTDDADVSAVESKKPHKTTSRGKAINRSGLTVGRSFSGHASWYGPGFHGRTAADGSRYNMYAFTAAHKTLPFGTLVEVRNKNNNKTVVVRITDRGPFIAGRVIDLSKVAAQAIGMAGVAPVSVAILGKRGSGKLLAMKPPAKPTPKALVEAFPSEQGVESSNAAEKAEKSAAGTVTQPVPAATEAPEAATSSPAATVGAKVQRHPVITTTPPSAAADAAKQAVRQTVKQQVPTVLNEVQAKTAATAKSAASTVQQVKSTIKSAPQRVLQQTLQPAAAVQSVNPLSGVGPISTPAAP